MKTERSEKHYDSNHTLMEQISKTISAVTTMRFPLKAEIVGAIIILSKGSL